MHQCHTYITKILSIILTLLYMNSIFLQLHFRVIVEAIAEAPQARAVVGRQLEPRAQAQAAQQQLPGEAHGQVLGAALAEHVERIGLVALRLLLEHLGSSHKDMDSIHL